MLSGDIGSAYLNAETKEKIFTSLGAEFGEDIGLKTVVKKDIYGLKPSGNTFDMHLCETMTNMGLKQSKLDPAIWYRLRNDKKGYDYFSHHVDDFLVSGKNPKLWIEQLEK